MYHKKQHKTKKPMAVEGHVSKATNKITKWPEFSHHKQILLGAKKMPPYDHCQSMYNLVIKLLITCSASSQFEWKNLCQVVCTTLSTNIHVPNIVEHAIICNESFACFANNSKSMGLPPSQMNLCTQILISQLSPASKASREVANLT